MVSSGPVLYYQNRGGGAGRTIRVWKLGTMHADAESLLSRHLPESPEAREEWSQGLFRNIIRTASIRNFAGCARRSRQR
jgi:lipopolysaccharide/colanic/teichoic acid biosynthesis glycosyltransferase